MNAEDVAKKALNGLKAGQFTIPCNFEGVMLAIATSGLSPQRSAATALLEVLGAGLMRVVALVFQWNWYSAIQNFHANR
jgi:3-dehydrosphinganine reductase